MFRFDRKQEVFNKIKDTWKDKVKVITREDIIDYGRKKLTIAEDEDVNNIQKVAKAASEKFKSFFILYTILSPFSSPRRGYFGNIYRLS